MTLRLRIVSPAKVPPGFDQDIELVGGPVTVGRAPECDLVLADPARQLSKRHCVIVPGPGGLSLTDTSANGIYINGAAERTPRDQPVAISAGDVLRMGDYEMRLEEVAGAAYGAHGRSDPAYPDPAFADPLDRTEAGPFAPPLPDEPDTGGAHLIDERIKLLRLGSGQCGRGFV